MREVQYRRFLDDNNILRIRFELDHGQVVSFVAQLECYFPKDDQWHPVIRYDTAHGFAHRDKMHPHKDTEKTELPVGNFSEGLTFAIKDLELNWQAYRRRYEE